MKSILLSLGIVVVVLTSACSIEPPSNEVDASLRVVSFNIRYGLARDGDDAWPKRKELVLERLQAAQADLIGLQECLPLQREWLVERLPRHAVYSVGRDGPSGEACTILWRKTRFELLAQGSFWLSETPGDAGSKSWDASLTRIVSWVRLRDRSSSEVFSFANTHFDHRGREARLQSARLIASRLPRARLILTGDLNAGENSPPLAALREAGFVDSFRVLHAEAKEVGTFSGFRELGEAKIDYVLLRGDWDVLEAGIDVARPSGRWPSDHTPVTATLRLR